MIPALISRCELYQFEPLALEDIKALLGRALKVVAAPAKSKGDRDGTGVAPVDDDVKDSDSHSRFGRRPAVPGNP